MRIIALLLLALLCFAFTACPKATEDDQTMPPPAGDDNGDDGGNMIDE